MECVCRKLSGGRLDVTQVCVGRLPLFEGLSPDELAHVMSGVTRHLFAPGQFIFHAGDPADQMFLLKAGRVKLTKVTEEGNEITLDIRKAGDFLGESMLSESSEFPVSAVCMEETGTCGFTRAGFERLVMTYPGVGLQVMKNLSRQMDRLSVRLGSMSYTTLEERLYQVLANVAREYGTRSGKGYAIAFPLTHEELGFLVGAHRVSITKAMKALSETGRVSRQGRTVVVYGDGLN